MLTLDKFQEQAQTTNLMDTHALYHLLGLMSEVGEIAEHMYTQDNGMENTLAAIRSLGKIAGEQKRRLRDKNEQVRWFLFKENAALELGDVLWYTAMVAHSCDTTLGNVGEHVLAKLADRANRGVIKGSGDTR